MEEPKINLFSSDQGLLAVERTKLANERTFLSWIRTGLSCVGGGVAFIKLINFKSDAHIIAAKISGQMLIITGIIFLLFSLINYRNLNNRLLKIPGVKETSTYVITASVCVLITLSIVFLSII